MCCQCWVEALAVLLEAEICARVVLIGLRDGGAPCKDEEQCTEHDQELLFHELHLGAPERNYYLKPLIFYVTFIRTGYFLWGMDLSAIPVHARVRVTTKTTAYVGLWLPKEGETVVIKLDSGYNIGLFPRHVTSVDVLERQQKAPAKRAVQVEQSSALETVRILHTGGTIASKIDYATGGVVAHFNPEELIEMFPELSSLAYIESDLIRNMQSDDFRFVHFNIIAKSILSYAKKGERRFIVTCGTDFLHYLSSALAFLLQDVPVGVLVVGSQRSSDRGSSDAGMNLACATAFLASQDFKGVGVCMHESTADETCIVIPGTAARKMHSSRRDAFRPINQGPWARIDYVNKSVSLLTALPAYDAQAKVPSKLPLFKEDLKVGMLYAHPQMFLEEFKTFESFDGLVLVASGLGHFPITDFDEHTKDHLLFRKEIGELCKKMPVALAVQTIYGRVHLNVYAPQRVLRQLGVLGHLSTMTPETSFVKLAWLLSNYDAAKVRALFMQDLVGELNHDESNGYW